MGEPLLKPGEKYSYADYLSWPEDERWELNNGEAWAMSPAPASRHQRIAGDLFGFLWQYLKGKPCNIFPAPFDVRFIKEGSTEDQDLYTVFQPDISVICDSGKIDDKGCLGSPDLIIEILSPSSSYRDQTEKLKVYEEYGVKEYWIVNPDRPSIEVFVHDGAVYGKPEYYKGNETIYSSVLEGLRIDLSEVFG